MTFKSFILPLLLAASCIAQDASKSYDAPPPVRPLPTESNRPMASGPALFVDTAKGSDKAAGSEKAPLKTLTAALAKVVPGQTIYLRGGVYYEQPSVVLRGEKDKPITIRSYPGELAILDGGIRDFVEHPETAWVPFEGGGPGEFRSAKTYEPQGETRPLDVPGAVNVQGLFADTMVPLHAYWSTADFRTSNELWTLDSKVQKATIRATGKVAPSTAPVDDENVNPNAIWCGPGILYDPATKYIHVRLAHTFDKGVGSDNYNGETDPRKLKLVISRPGRGDVLKLEDSCYVNLQDLVLRGSRGSPLAFEECQDITLDGITAYAGHSCLQASYTQRVHINNCAFRGIAAPWTFRSSLKYRSIEARIISISGWLPSGNADWEFENSEFTDSVDGIFIGSVHNVKFHHNYVDNLSDDGFFLTAATGYDGVTPGGNIHIYQNYISRVLTVMAFGVGHGRQKLTENGRQTGAGVWFYRNVVDQRDWIPYFQHREADQYDYEPRGRMGGDHGSPTWEPMFIYQNTILMGQDSFRDYYMGGMSAAVGPTNPRRLYNNIYVQMSGLPGTVFPHISADLLTSTNLHWDLTEGPKLQGDFFAKFRGSKVYKESETAHAPGWTAGDQFADPKFGALTPLVRDKIDLRLQDGSPAIDAGTVVPSDWPDPVRDKDKGKPDLGAIPAGVEAWPVGINGRNRISGVTK